MELEPHLSVLGQNEGEVVTCDLGNWRDDPLLERVKVPS